MPPVPDLNHGPRDSTRIGTRSTVRAATIGKGDRSPILPTGRATVKMALKHADRALKHAAKISQSLGGEEAEG